MALRRARSGEDDADDDWGDNVKYIAAAASALVLAIIGLTAANAAAGTRPPATEHFEAMSTNPVSAVATLIARGPVTIGGTVNLETGHAVLHGGKLTLAHHQLHSSSTFSKRTCLATLTSSGTYRITGGTGRYRLVRGHGDYRLTAYAIVAKVRGKCEVKVVPYAQETLLTASGPIQQ
jgi:hypothetical protein